MTKAPALAAALTLSVASGCAATVDGIYAISGPKAQPTLHGTKHISGVANSWTEVEFDSEFGIICTLVDEPQIERPSGSVEINHPNGFKLPMQFFTVTEGLALGAATAIHAGTCEDCFGPTFALAMAPFAIDLAWGIYRSLTIRDPIYRRADIRFSRGIGAPEDQGSVSCGEGTVIIAEGGGRSWTLEFDIQGRLRGPSLDIAVAIARLGDAVEFRGQRSVRIDNESRRAFVDAVDRQNARELADRAAADRAARANVTPPPPIRPRARAVVKWRDGQPIIVGIELDIDTDLVCQSDAACQSDERCLDRGDGVPLCMGPRTTHGFCASSSDCPVGERCIGRAGGARVCSIPRPL